MAAILNSTQSYIATTNALLIQGMTLSRVSFAAKKTAALETIKLLHEAREIVDVLKAAVTYKVSDREDEDKMEGFINIKHAAGTHENITYYKNKVASCLKESYPKVGDTNYLYVFAITDNNTGKYFQMKDNNHCTTLGLLTSKPLPYTKISPFSSYIGNTELIICLIERQYFVKSKQELKLCQFFHKVLFLSIKKKFLYNITSERNYLIVPVMFAPEISLMFIDRKVMKEIVQFRSTNLITPKWPFDWRDKIVVENHAKNNKKGKPQVYEVLSYDSQTTPLSTFPNSDTTTFAQYFNTNYGHAITNYNDPSLVCHVNSLCLASSNLSTPTTVIKSRKNQIKLFPELCKVWPISASFWKYSCCVPSIIKRIESLLLVNELSNEISMVTNIGIGSNFEYENESSNFTTNNTRRHHSIKHHQPINDISNNSSIFYSKIGKIYDQETTRQLEKEVVLDCVLRRPNNLLLLQSLTPFDANDEFDLERLKLLGIFLLKLSMSMSLFCSENCIRELTILRDNLLSKFNLSHLAKKKGLPLNIPVQTFNPFSNWIPPCFKLPVQNLTSNPLNQSQYSSSTNAESAKNSLLIANSVSPIMLRSYVRRYYYYQMTDEKIADCIRSLIGAYLISGGIESGIIALMKDWIYLETSCDPDFIDIATYTSRTQSKSRIMNIDYPSLSLESYSINYINLYQNSSDIFTSFYVLSSPLLHQDIDENIVSNMIVQSGNNIDTLCDELNWTFSNPAFLLEALTHSSYTENQYTGSYGRLAFLGDAVLNYLITCCLYSEFPHYTVDQLNCAISMLINNNNFAEISVKLLKLHTCLFYHCPHLFKSINDYVDNISLYDTIKEDKRVMYCQHEKDSNSAVHVMDLQLQENKPNEDKNDSEVFEVFAPPKELADVLESIAGALFIDSGMSLETVWQRFYPFFKPTIDEIKVDGPFYVMKKLSRTKLRYKLVQDLEPIRMTHRCTIKLINEKTQVTCVSRDFIAAKTGAAKRILAKLKDREIKKFN